MSHDGEVVDKILDALEDLAQSVRDLVHVIEVVIEADRDNKDNG